MSTTSSGGEIPRLPPSSPAPGADADAAPPEALAKPLLRSRSFVALALAALAVTVVTLIRLPIAYSTGSGLNHSAAVWITLATDLGKHGVFYRPLIDEAGYGGTRYFPLHFVIHAGLVKAGLAPLPSGFVLSWLGAVTLLVGFYRLLRKHALQAPVAACGAALVLSGVATQIAVTTIRSDLTAAALNVCGLVCCASALRDSSKKVPVLLASTLFVLAFATKVTMLFGAAAVFLVLLRQRRWREANVFGAATVIGCVLVVALTNALSGGRFIESFRATSLAGGGLKEVLGAPMMLLFLWGRNDTVSFTILTGTLLRLQSLPPKAWRELPLLNFCTTLAGTLVMLGTPGTWLNHLIDIHVAALFLIFGLIEKKTLRLERMSYALAVLGFFTAISWGRTGLAWDRIPQRADYEKALDVAGRSGAPLLAENPLLPLMNEERPFLLDPFALRVMGLKDPTFSHDIAAKLDAHYFRAVILTFSDPETGIDRKFSKEAHFGEGFIESLQKNYEPVSRIGTTVSGNPLGFYPPVVVYRPRSDGGSSAK